MLRNGEYKLYRGKQITKISNSCYQVGGLFEQFKTYEDAKSTIDALWAEDMALDRIDRYVERVCGGYL